jgi:predicted lipoprotein with Yx(FWY)xxD motif
MSVHDIALHLTGYTARITRHYFSMKTALIGILVVVVVAGGVFFYTHRTAQTEAAGPTHAMGLNGSPNQGNLGQPDNGSVQQPLGDGLEEPVAGDSLVLGVSSNAKVGTYLVGYTGMTLYTFDKDTGSASTCYDTCAKNWPPYIVSSADNLEHVVAGLDDTLVRTTVRTDGQLQLTYKGHPLYFYAKDATSADISGDGIGGIWHVAKK